MKFFILSFITSLLTTLWIVRAVGRHALLDADHNTRPQNFHSRPVPRIGGLALVAGVIVALSWVPTSFQAVFTEESGLLWLLLLAALPAFLSGVVEDVFKNVSPRRRLICNGLSALLGVALLDAVLLRTDIALVDYAIQWRPVAVMFTLFVVTGVTNSVNIIDGFNGLASMCVMFILLALAFVAFQLGDTFVFTAALVVAGAVLGFFVWNYPAGLVFLGDGGAYFLGFMVAELSILLIHRHVVVSPIFPLLLCAYPIFETLFSIYRRRIVRGVAAIVPDGIHLHTLIHRRVIRPAYRAQHVKPQTKRQTTQQTTRNSMTSPYLWLLCLLSVIPAVIWWNNTAMLTFFLFLFMASYVLLYCRILRFQTPKWLLLYR
jgi:UDP-N-acetylmuramyl pentapeptide phosphotransferase/UDP-N-acetylglucosamine-1-phosphate transferase